LLLGQSPGLSQLARLALLLGHFLALALDPARCQKVAFELIQRQIVPTFQFLELEQWPTPRQVLRVARLALPFASQFAQSTLDAQIIASGIEPAA
jgi:hypothetical protein